MFFHQVRCWYKISSKGSPLLKPLKDLSTIILSITLWMRKISNEAIYYYTLGHLEGNSNYKDHMGLYEKPLIETGLKKYGSQLQLSRVLGINRNTLTKKKHEHHIG